MTDHAKRAPWRKKSLIMTAVCGGVLLCVGSCCVVLTRALEGDPLPAILLHVTAAGGLWGACPPREEYEARIQKGYPSALSPELNERLSLQFPPGTSGSALMDTLSQQGFTAMPPCPEDSSIHQAEYKQKNGLTPATAAIYWKVDKLGMIVWAKGFVAYDGL